MGHRGYDWGDDYMEEYHKDQYDEKQKKAKRDQLEYIIFKIRSELKNELINVYLSKDLSIVLSYTIDRCIKLNEFSSILKELSDLEDEYLSTFEISTFDLGMEEENPTIYCSYERVKII
jgi:hypothetical protein